MISWRRCVFANPTQPVGYNALNCRRPSGSVCRRNQRRARRVTAIDAHSISMVSAGRDAETIFGSAPAVSDQTVELGISIRILPWAVVVIRFSAVQQIAGA